MAEKRERTEWEERARDEMKALLGGMKIKDLWHRLRANDHNLKYTTLQMALLRGRYHHSLYLEICKILGKKLEVTRVREAEDVMRMVRKIEEDHGVLIGHNQAERIVLALERSRMPDELEVKGIRKEDGNPTKITITSKEMSEVLEI